LIAHSLTLVGIFLEDFLGDFFLNLKSLITWIFTAIEWSLGVLTLVILVRRNSVLRDSGVSEGCFSSGLESLEGQDRTTGPGKNGEEGKEYSANDVGAGKVELDFFSFAPCDAHVNEGDEIKEGPQTGECHVEYDVMFASLDGGHLLKEPFAHEESDGSQESHDADHGGKVASTGFHIHDTHFHVLLLQEKPSR